MKLFSPAVPLTTTAPVFASIAEILPTNFCGFGVLGLFFGAGFLTLCVAVGLLAGLSAVAAVMAKQRTNIGASITLRFQFISVLLRSPTQVDLNQRDTLTEQLLAPFLHDHLLPFGADLRCRRKFIAPFKWVAII